MNVTAPIALIAASYSSADDAVQDFQAVWASRTDGEFHHTSLAVLTRDSDGRLQVGRNNSTAKHLEWGGALLGGALFVVAPAAGADVLSTVGLSGAGAIIGHLRDHADPDELRAASAVLELGTSALLVVLVNRRGEAVSALLGAADHRASVHVVWGDLEEELAHDFSKVRTASALIAS
jgi:uncharacterized membrane protein